MAAIRVDFEKVAASLPSKNAISDVPYMGVGKNDLVFGCQGGTVEPFVFREESLGRVLIGDRVSEPWQEGLVFEFCKTEHCPHDLAVTVALIVIKNHLTDKVRIYTDGEDKDWDSARQLCQKALGYGEKVTIVEGEVL